MGLSSALGNALSGMQVTQSALDVVSRNVANSGTPGYHRQSVNVTDQPGGVSSYATSSGVQRAFTQSLQAQYTREISDSASASVQSSYLGQLQTYLGKPGDAGSLDTVYGAFRNALTALTASPGDYSTRASVVTNAQALTSTLNQLTASIQGLRQQANGQIGSDVNDVNQSLTSLVQINNKLIDQNTDSTSRANLMDQRDRLVARVASVVDVNVTYRDDGTVALATRSGVGLLDQKASVFQFQAAGALSPNAQFSPDDASNGVGKLTVLTPAGLHLDLVKQDIVKSGELGGLINLRDKTLVAAQGQLDDIAAGLAQSLSTTQISGTAASGPTSSGTANGYSLDLSGVQPGNDFVLNYSENGVAKSLKVLQVTDASKLPIDYVDAAGTRVVGFDYSTGASGVASKLNTVLGAGFSASASGTSLTVLNDGTTANGVTSLTKRLTTTTTQGGDPALSVFVDSGNGTFTNSLDGAGQKLGFAGRISVNADILANNALLVQSAPTASLGDATRANYLADQLDSMNFAGIPTASSGTGGVLNGSVASLVSQMMDYQGSSIAAASSANQSHSDSMDALNTRMTSEYGVNINDEMARLVVLQNAYSANARVVSTVQQLLTSLMNTMR